MRSRETNLRENDAGNYFDETGMRILVANVFP